MTDIRNDQASMIILASGSPRRKEIFEQHGWNVSVRPSDAEEILPFEMSPAETTMFLSLKKALCAEADISSEETDRHPLIVAADTVVYKKGCGIMGKPHDEKELTAMLSALSGTSHQVITGAALLKAGLPVRRLFCGCTDVYFRECRRADILAYSKTAEPYDKAGGYAIQGTWGRYVDHIDGDRDNVIGFPWQLFTEVLERL